MTMVKAFSDLKRIKGVEAYILLDAKGNVLLCNDGMKVPEKLSKLIYFCGRKLSIIGKKHFKYMFFSRRSKKDFLIFPVGDYYLGVINKAGSRNFETASTVIEFLENLAESQIKSEVS